MDTTIYMDKVKVYTLFALCQAQLFIWPSHNQL